jgi:hypothetical protein
MAGIHNAVKRLIFYSNKIFSAIISRSPRTRKGKDQAEK